MKPLEDFNLLDAMFGKAAPETGLVLFFVSLHDIYPSPENDTLYKPCDPKDPEIQALAESIRKEGILQPLMLTQDNFILSGHRRYTAARLAGLTEVPCFYDSIYHDDPQFVPRLREHNRQREKTDSEKLREEIVSANPEEAYRALTQHRKKTSHVDLPPIRIEGEKIRREISAIHLPFLEAAIAVINRLRAFWPLSLRQIHYQLLNQPPLKNAKKPESKYENNKRSYQDLSDLLTRARLSGVIDMEIIADETRPSVTWDVHPTTTPFIRQEMDAFLKGYYRNLQQTQPNHIEVLGEKNTVLGILRPVAGDYRIPLTIGRGYASVPPRYQMAERFRKSGKEKLILLVLSDFDPDGEEICHSFARSMRDDFGIDTIHPVKVGLTHAQVRRLHLPPSMEAKEDSSNYAKFVEKYGTNAYELEAVSPEQLQRWLREAIDSVMDIDAFNAEIEHEKEDAAYLDRVRTKVNQELKTWMQEKAD